MSIEMEDLVYGSNSDGLHEVEVSLGEIANELSLVMILLIYEFLQ